MDSLFLLDSFSFRLGPLERNGKDTVRSVQFNSLDTPHIFIEKRGLKMTVMATLTLAVSVWLTQVLNQSLSCQYTCVGQSGIKCVIVASAMRAEHGPCEPIKGCIREIREQ